MKKILSISLIIVLCIGLFSACKLEDKSQKTQSTTSATPENNKAANVKVVNPLPETLNINSLDNCTVSVSLEKGNAYVDDSGKMVMKLKVYSYEVYDMVDISLLTQNNVIVRQNEEITVTDIEHLESGVVRINGGEENGGFDLFSDNATMYYEIGMNDAKAFYELGEVTLPVNDEFEYIDESGIETGAKTYFAGDFLTENSGIDYHFVPYNTSVVIENGMIVKMNRVYMP